MNGRAVRTSEAGIGELRSGTPSKVVAFGEVLLRLASRAPTLLLQEARFDASFCGAEANVAVALAGFGHDCRMVTALPENTIGDGARAMLKGLGVAVEAPALAASRMGLFYLQPGAMSRAAKIVYDRAGSAFATRDRYDWTALLEGADWLYVSGITAALGDAPLGALREAMAVATNAGVRIAFDTNYRPTLWQGREDLAAAVMRELASSAELLFAGRRASAMMTGMTFADPDPDAAFLAAARAMFELSPRLGHMAATRREIHSSDRQGLTGLLADRYGLSVTPRFALERIIDRVGTGDAYAAGILHGLATDAPRDATVAFATDCARWAHSIPGDFLRATVADIERLSLGSGDVSR